VNVLQTKQKLDGHVRFLLCIQGILCRGIRNVGAEIENGIAYALFLRCQFSTSTKDTFCCLFIILRLLNEKNEFYVSICPVN